MAYIKVLKPIYIYMCVCVCVCAFVGVLFKHDYFYNLIFCVWKRNMDICRCCYKENGVFAHCK